MMSFDVTRFTKGVHTGFIYLDDYRCNALYSQCAHRMDIRRVSTLRGLPKVCIRALHIKMIIGVMRYTHGVHTGWT